MHAVTFIIYHDQISNSTVLYIKNHNTILYENIIIALHLIKPTKHPSNNPTEIPTKDPTNIPTEIPTKDPITSQPTYQPSDYPSAYPTNTCVQYGISLI